tara:strand:+ start:2210 stop:2461 length:252 start_codon:yes stop_codon:yes gene_type:complete
MELGIIILMTFFVTMISIFIIQSYFIINVINKNKIENRIEMKKENEIYKEPEQFFPPLRRKVYPNGLSTEQESELDFGVFSTY